MHACYPNTQDAEQETHEFKASQGYTENLSEENEGRVRELGEKGEEEERETREKERRQCTTAGRKGLLTGLLLGTCQSTTLPI